jgi:hypothetical protein
MKRLGFTLFLLTLLAMGNATASRLYVGDMDGQFMAGVDTRIDFGPFFVGGDVRTIIRKTVVNEDEKVVGFMPDRSDYKTSCGIVLGMVELEYSHTCYHRVISSEDLLLYQGNENPEDTNVVAMKITF